MASRSTRLPAGWPAGSERRRGARDAPSGEHARQWRAVRAHDASRIGKPSGMARRAGLGRSARCSARVSRLGSPSPNSIHADGVASLLPGVASSRSTGHQRRSAAPRTQIAATAGPASAARSTATSSRFRRRLTRDFQCVTGWEVSDVLGSTCARRPRRARRGRWRGSSASFDGVTRSSRSSRRARPVRPLAETTECRSLAG